MALLFGTKFFTFAVFFINFKFTIQIQPSRWNACGDRINSICKNGGTCTPGENSAYSCICPEGYSGRHCESNDPCQLKKCGLNERCRSVDGEGAKCIPTPCSSNPCLYKGKCRNIQHFRSFRCACIPNRYGKQCELERIQHLPSTVTLNQDSTGNLTDQENTEFESCNKELSHRCKNNSTCIIHGELGYTCICTEGWTGADCRTKAKKHLSNESIEHPILKRGRSLMSIRRRAIKPKVNDSNTFDPCSSEPCFHGGECIPAADGSFRCDCPREFLGPLCILTDPCNGGNGDCKFGSTCVRKSDTDYVCECRIPYKGDHCEELDLCLIEYGECVDDVARKARCYPCRLNEMCKKNGTDSYTCYNITVPTDPTFEELELHSNPFIPATVITVLVLYIFILLFALFIDRLNRTRPRLVIMGDIERIAIDTFYLITVETGNDWFAGTHGKISCEIYGDRARTKVLILNNYLMGTMRQNDDIDFLISTPTPLGNILKIQLWLDPDDKRNLGLHPSWYCRNVIIRDIKTEQCWYFFVRQWLAFEIGTSPACEVETATQAEVSKFYTTRLSYAEFWRQIREHHMWFHTFTCKAKSVHTRAERITSATALCLSYMFFSMVLYGFPETIEHQKRAYHHQVDFSSYYPIFSLGTKSSLICVLLGYVLALSFRLIRRHLVPALIVWDEDETQDALTLRNARIQTDVKETEPVVHFAMFEPEQMMPKLPPTPFRIPSTDILETEKWIEQVHVNPSSVVRTLYERSPYGYTYVHNYQGTSHCDFNLNQWSVGENTPSCFKREQLRQQRLRRPYDTSLISTGAGMEYQWRDSVAAAQLSVITEAFADPIPDPIVVYHQKSPRGRLQHAATKFLNNALRKRSDLLKTEEWQSAGNAKPTMDSKAEYIGDTNPFPGDVDFYKSPSLPQVPVMSSIGTNTTEDNSMSIHLKKEHSWKLELCSLEHRTEEHRCLPYSFIWVAWGFSLLLIIVFSSLLVIYGYRFSWHKSLNWFASFSWAVLESIFIFQPLKVFATQLIILYRRRAYQEEKNSENPDEKETKLRFKLLWIRGPAYPLVIWPLYYSMHPLWYNREHEVEPEKRPFPLVPKEKPEENKLLKLIEPEPPRPMKESNLEEFYGKNWKSNSNTRKNDTSKVYQKNVKPPTPTQTMRNKAMSYEYPGTPITPTDERI